jgi:hypothetical protein
MLNSHFILSNKLFLECVSFIAVNTVVLLDHVLICPEFCMIILMLGAAGLAP